MGTYKELSVIYDKLLCEDINYEEWSNFILKKCHEYNIARDSYVDLACGTGNITEYLYKGFKSTTAVDLSDYMLTMAEEKLRGKHINFVCQDIINLNLHGRFDVATCILDSTNYILKDDELKQYFKSVYNHLNEKGLFVFDMNSYYKLMNIMGNNIFNYDDDNVVYMWENNCEDDIIYMDLTFFVREGELYRRFDESHQERAYTSEAVTKYLEDTGFRILQVLDGYSNNKANINSERILYIVQKESNCNER